MAEATTPRPNVLAMAEQANFAAAKALHHERMKAVCYSIKAHYRWAVLERGFSASFLQYCCLCGKIISPEFSKLRHVGLCDLKACLAEEDFDGPSAHESFYSCSYPYISRSSYSGPPRDKASNCRSMFCHFSSCFATDSFGTCSQK